MSESIDRLANEPNWGESPEPVLDWLAARPAAWACDITALLDRLVLTYEVPRLQAALAGRLHALDGAHGEVVLRLLEAYPSDALLEELAAVLVECDDLPLERVFEALALLQGSDLFETSPLLRERLDELNDLAAAEGEMIAELAAELGDGSSLEVTLAGLARVEPELRAELVEELAAQPLNDGLIELLRELRHDPDGPTRAAAWRALVSIEPADPGFARAADWPVQALDAASRVESSLVVPAPRVLEGRVSGIDRLGRARLGVLSAHEGQYHAATFSCDLMIGINAMDPLGTPQLAQARAHLDAAFAGPTGGSLCDDGRLACALLAGCWMLGSRVEASHLRGWLDMLVGLDFGPRPFPVARASETPAAAEPGHLALHTKALLQALPEWLDRSELTYALAEELLMRPDGPPDLQRHAAVVRYIFERGLLERLESDRRMLLWMAAVWERTGLDSLANAARVVHDSLAENQLLAPFHPVLGAFVIRSLRVAQADLRARQSRQAGGSADLQGPTSA